MIRWKSDVDNGVITGKLNLPHTRRLTGFKAGRSLAIEGVVNKDAKHLVISLQPQYASPPRTDVTLLLSADFEENSLQANTFLYESWGAAVLCKQKFPFEQGKKFVVLIQAEGQFYKVLVNGEWMFDYDHRLPLDKAAYVRLDGDASFYNVQCPHLLELPYLTEAPQGLRVGSSFSMDGYIWPRATNFVIRFTEGPDQKDKGSEQAIFMLETKFRNGKTKVEMNSQYKRKAEEEGLVEGDLSLQPSQDIKLRIMAGEGKFTVDIDDDFFAEYDHKLPIETLTHVSVDGDINLYDVKINRPARRRLSSVKKASANWKNDENCGCCTII